MAFFSFFLSRSKRFRRVAVQADRSHEINAVIKTGMVSESAALRQLSHEKLTKIMPDFQMDWLDRAPEVEPFWGLVVDPELEASSLPAVSMTAGLFFFFFFFFFYCQFSLSIGLVHQFSSTGLKILRSLSVNPAFEELVGISRVDLVLAACASPSFFFFNVVDQEDWGYLVAWGFDFWFGCLLVFCVLSFLFFSFLVFSFLSIFHRSGGPSSVTFPLHWNNPFTQKRTASLSQCCMEIESSIPESVLTGDSDNEWWRRPPQVEEGFWKEKTLPEGSEVVFRVRVFVNPLPPALAQHKFPKVIQPDLIEVKG
jgi:hypothetical protein